MRVHHSHTAEPMARRRLAAFGGALALLLTMAGSAAAAPPQGTSGFVGQWVTTDCPVTPEGVLDCSVWGDGSSLFLTIGTGDHPRATIQDSFAIGCQVNGNPATHFTAAGIGTYDGDHLWLDFSLGGCGPFRPAQFTMQLYHDFGSDTLWEDEDGDGYGYIWYRHNGLAPGA